MAWAGEEFSPHFLYILHLNDQTNYMPDMYHSNNYEPQRVNFVYPPPDNSHYTQSIDVTQ